jgi:hypothetical protein
VGNCVAFTSAASFKDVTGAESYWPWWKCSGGGTDAFDLEELVIPHVDARGEFEGPCTKCEL